MMHPALLQPLLFEAGDRMSREEFLERWERMPELKFAELIDGVVYLPSPLSTEHARTDNWLQTVSGIYALQSAVCEALSNPTCLLLESAPQPDVALRLLPQFGGKSGNKGKLASGAPELVGEVAVSSRSYDLGPKLALYQRAGVDEYVCAIVESQTIEWRVLRGGSYQLLEPVDGVFRSETFPGLWLDSVAYWRKDGKRLLATLHAGMNSPEYAAFIHRLSER